MIDVKRVKSMLDAHGLDAWAAVIDAQLHRAMVTRRHGDWNRWEQALKALPDLGPGEVSCAQGPLVLAPDREPDAAHGHALRAALMQLLPWRKGPYRLAGVDIDTEWRSDWKWQRVAPHIEPLAGRLVLDVGCGNGYHCWRMADAGARQVIGIDPTMLFLAQFLAIRRLLKPMEPALAQRVELLPVGIEALPGKLRAFDTVFSMGVLYHRRSPIDHLFELRDALRPGGQLVLETLVVDGDEREVLVPAGRYAKMRNVWFIPSTAMLENWLRRTGFSRVTTVDATVTSVQEQRSTEWMTFESLADFLDPADSRFTIEGYPAPKRAILTATA